MYEVQVRQASLWVSDSLFEDLRLAIFNKRNRAAGRSCGTFVFDGRRIILFGGQTRARCAPSSVQTSAPTDASRAAYRRYRRPRGGGGGDRRDGGARILN